MNPVDVHSNQRQLFSTIRKHIRKIGPSSVPWKAAWNRIDNTVSLTLRFLSQSNLTKHMSCHSLEKTNSCPFCERHYKRKSDMVRHMKKIHKELMRVESTKYVHPLPPHFQWTDITPSRGESKAEGNDPLSPGSQQTVARRKLGLRYTLIAILLFVQLSLVLGIFLFEQWPDLLVSTPLA